MLGKRILTALVGIPFAIYVFTTGGWLFAITIAIISSIGIWEFLNLAKAKGANPNYVLPIALNFAMQILFYQNIGSQNIFLFPSLAIIAAYVISFLLQLWQSGSALHNINSQISSLIYVGLSFLSLIALFEFQNIALFSSDLQMQVSEGSMLVFILFLGVWICDSAAYFVGKAIGKRKLFERISPKKTWEGTIGGFLASIIGIYALSIYMLPNLALESVIVIGLAVGIFGQIGDLAESQLKRDAGIKDSSQILPGHGGILDRFDSIMFVAPIVLLYFAILSFLN